MIAEMSTASFLEALGSGRATPGGGAVTALAAAQGVALYEMVSRISGISQELEELVAARKKLLSLSERDGEAFSAVMAAYPKRSSHPDTYIEALGGARQVQSEVLQAVEGLQPVFRRVRIGHRASLTSDLDIADALIEAARQGAQVLVDINQVEP